MVILFTRNHPPVVLHAVTVLQLVSSQTSAQLTAWIFLAVYPLPVADENRDDQHQIPEAIFFKRLAVLKGTATHHHGDTSQASGTDRHCPQRGRSGAASGSEHFP